VSLLLVPVARKLAFKWDILDHPGERKIHVEPKPYLGGLAIYGSFIFVIAINLVLYLTLKSQPYFADNFPGLVRQAPLLNKVTFKLIAILGGATLLVILGFIDDVKGVSFSPKLKFFAQLAIAAITVFLGVRTSFLPFDWLDWMFSIFWIVGISNSFNLLDNMDGLSSGVAAISGFIFFCITAYQGQLFMAMILAVFIGSTLGFLKHNYNPSKIFMGDTGSLFLGYILASLTIEASYVTAESSSLLPALMPLIILSIPLFDTISVIIIRIKEHRPIYVGDKRHLSHRLVDMGFSPRSAVNLIYLLTVSIGLAAFLLPNLSVGESMIVLLQVLIILIIVTILMFVGKRNKKQN